MAFEFSKNGKVVYALFLLAVSVYFFLADQFSFRRITLEGFELNIMGAAFLVGAIDMLLSAVFNYSSKATEHFYKFYHYMFMATSICLIVIAIVFTQYEDELFR